MHLTISDPDVLNGFTRESFGSPKLRLTMEPVGKRYLSIAYIEQPRIELHVARHAEPHPPAFLLEEVAAFNRDPEAGWDAVLTQMHEAKMFLIDEELKAMQDEKAASLTRFNSLVPTNRK